MRSTTHHKGTHLEKPQESHSLDEGLSNLNPSPPSALGRGTKTHVKSEVRKPRGKSEVSKTHGEYLIFFLWETHEKKKWRGHCHLGVVMAWEGGEVT